MGGSNGDLEGHNHVKQGEKNNKYVDTVGQGPSATAWAEAVGQILTIPYHRG